MNTSYDAWARFDVEQELERVDLRAQREEQDRQARKQAQAKRGVEDSIAQSSEDAAEILAAQAAVAALKAKRKGRRGSRNAKGTVNAPVMSSNDSENASEKTPGGTETRESDDDAEVAERLKRQAQLLKRKHQLLQQTVTARRDGEAILEASKDSSECRGALARFEAALEATRALEAMLPELSQEQEREQRDASDHTAKSDEKTHNDEHGVEKKSHHDHDHHHHNDQCSHGCSHNQHGSEPTTPAVLPQPSDMKAVVDMFYKDIYLGIGTCHTRANRHALASEAFKEVLVRDRSHLRAWMLRGGAFEAMDAPLLAMLHYNRVTTLALNDEEGNKAHEEIKRKLFDEETGAKDGQQRAEFESPEEALAAIAETFQQGNVIMVEGFYDYAVRKFKAVLRMLEAAKQRQTSTESRVAIVKPEVLRQLEIAANMNIASASLEMQRDYGMALAHCERVLELDPNNAVCHFRMGQLLRASHKYEKAIGHLERAQQLPTKTYNSAQFADAIAKEMDKTQFDRGQYDYAFIKSAASREKHRAS